MIDGFGAILPLAGRAVAHPREAFREVLDTPMDRATVFRFAWLVVVLGLLAETLLQILFAPLQPPGAEPMPLGLSLLLQLISVFGLAAGVHFIGAMFGGRGSFLDALKAVTWFSFLMLVGQLLMVVLLALVPPLGALMLLALLVFGMVQLTALVMEVHGFTSIPFVVIGIIASAMIFGTFLLILLAALGVDFMTPPPAA